MASSTGIEPAAYSLGGYRSILLSYEDTQLAAYGYIPVMQEDGTIIYINEQTNYIAYEE